MQIRRKHALQCAQRVGYCRHEVMRNECSGHLEGDSRAGRAQRAPYAGRSLHGPMSQKQRRAASSPISSRTSIRYVGISSNTLPASRGDVGVLARLPPAACSSIAALRACKEAARWDQMLPSLAHLSWSMASCAQLDLDRKSVITFGAWALTDLTLSANPGNRMLVHCSCAVCLAVSPRGATDVRQRMRALAHLETATAPAASPASLHRRPSATGAVSAAPPAARKRRREPVHSVAMDAVVTGRSYECSKFTSISGCSCRMMAGQASTWFRHGCNDSCERISMKNISSSVFCANKHRAGQQSAGNRQHPYLRAREAQQAEGKPLEAGQVQPQRSRPVAGRVRRILALHDCRPLVCQARQLPAALHEHLPPPQRTRPPCSPRHEDGQYRQRSQLLGTPFWLSGIAGNPVRRSGHVIYVNEPVSRLRPA